MYGPDLTSFSARLTISSNNTNKHEDTIKTDAVVLNHLLLKCYATDNVFAKADEAIPNFKKAR